MNINNTRQKSKIYKKKKISVTNLMLPVCGKREMNQEKQAYHEHGRFAMAATLSILLEIKLREPGFRVSSSNRRNV